MKYILTVENNSPKGAPVSIGNTNKDKPSLLTIALVNDKDKLIASTYLKGMPLKASLELIEGWINKDIRGFRNFKNSYKEPLEVNENLGVKITLLCLATNCLKRLERIRGLIRTLENMTWEEMYYWYSKCRGKTKNKGLKAFRILFDNV